MTLAEIAIAALIAALWLPIVWLIVTWARAEHKHFEDQGRERVGLDRKKPPAGVLAPPRG
jgi:hypothetical protein